MVDLFVKDFGNTKFNNSYFKIDSLDLTLDDIKKLLYKKYNIKEKYILFSEEGRYIYNNLKLNELNQYKFISLGMHIRTGMP